MRMMVLAGAAILLAGCDRTSAPAGDQAGGSSRTAPASAVGSRAAGEAATVTYLDVPKPFRVTSGAGPAEAIECGAGKCYWQQKQSASIVGRTNGGVVIRLAIRGGTSTVPAGTSVPVRWSPDIEIGWRDLTSYLFCSLKRPAMLAKVDNSYHVERLQLYDTPKAQRATAEVYMEECHGLTSDAWNPQVLKQLGYAQVRASTMIYPSAKDGLKAMTR